MLSDGERVYNAEDLMMNTTYPSRTTYKMSGTLVEIEEDDGHSMDNYLKHFEVIGKDEAKYEVEGEDE